MGVQTKLRVAGENSTTLVRAVGHDADLCLREVSAASGCKRCVDICPGNALRIPSSKETPGGAKVTISKGFCIDCGLCSAVCPTGGITQMEPTLRTLRRRLRRASAQAEEGSHVYLTCVETGLAKDDLSVVEIPCLGMLTWESWANLMLDFPELAVYLPGDLCGRCKAKVAEMMIVDEVVHAQEATGSEMPLVETMRELDFTTATGTLRPDRRQRMLESKEDSFGSILRDVTQGEAANDDDLPSEDLGQLDSRRMRVRLRKEAAAAEGEETPGLADPDSLRGTVAPRRWAALDAALRFPQAASQMGLSHVEIDTGRADPEDLARCSAECPLGAVDPQGRVNPALCVACGLCADILDGKGAGEKSADKPQGTDEETGAEPLVKVVVTTADQLLAR